MAGAAPRPAFGRPLLLLCALVALAGLAWLGWRLGAPAVSPVVDARPALWRMEKDGRQAWLFGTIHAVPRGERWLSPPIADALIASDRLMLEVTGLDAERRSRATFERLGRASNLPPVLERLDTADATRLKGLIAAHPSAFHGLDGYKSWAAALLINAASSAGLDLSAQEAGEAVFTQRFTQAGKPIEGLETIAGQLGLFDALPEADQRLLLAQAVGEAGDAQQLYGDLHAAWARGDLARLEKQFLAPLSRSPSLRRALIDNRNARWASAIDTSLSRQPGTAFIAVGAGHLIGPASLQARLAALGWRIERVQ
jgi:uncharacterized protein YbaP (TraB family)